MSRVGIALFYMPLVETAPQDCDLSMAPDACIPRADVDMMNFCILPGFAPLNILNMKMGSKEVFRTMNILDDTLEATKMMKRILEANPGWTPGFSSLIPLAAPMLRLRGTSIVQKCLLGIPSPVEGTSEKWQGSKQLEWVLGQYETLRDQYREWEDEQEATRQGRQRQLTFPEDVHTCWDVATEYPLGLETRFKAFRYYDLMACHVTRAPNYYMDAMERLDNDQGREHFDMPGWITEGA
ncbi:MAG: hypothetical protein M1837_001431 [Sclerophora amabilis]|nr:MAG: hypothetical protein M1837_001431 [Sclerophora amabilis]